MATKLASFLPIIGLKKAVANVCRSRVAKVAYQYPHNASMLLTLQDFSNNFAARFEYQFLQILATKHEP
jgi:hypothetical protein